MTKTEPSRTTAWERHLNKAARES